VPESAKECDTVLPEGLDIGLGPGDRAFEPHYSDHNWTPVLIQCVSKRVSSFFFQKPLFNKVFVRMFLRFRIMRYGTGYAIPHFLSRE